MKRNNDIIAAVATPPGVGGIAVVRVSGTGAIDWVRRFVRGASFEPRHASFATFWQGGQMLDEVVVTTYRAPHSYTGEDVVEIACHGSQYVQQALLECLIQRPPQQCPQRGSQECEKNPSEAPQPAAEQNNMPAVRLAEPGEFTLRAFLNGKFDLSQAEAVADLIDSQSEAAHRLAVNQLRGGFSHTLSAIRDKFVELTSLLELELDFSDEDVEFADRSALRGLVDELEQEVQRLVDSFRLGNAIKNGIPVAIVGQPNVGKSTLLNQLLNEDRAIVSDIAGTTRDTIEDTLNLKGLQFRFIDTAGIRHSDDTVESAGIERSFKAMREAQIILYIVDARQPQTAVIAELTEVTKQVDVTGKLLFLLLNKIDLAESLPAAALPSAWQHTTVLPLSAKQGTHVEELKQALVGSVQGEWNSDATMLTNVRHYEAMTHILEALSHVREGFAQQLPADLVVVDIRDALYYLGQITGQVTSDEVLGSIFGRFCIGK